MRAEQALSNSRFQPGDLVHMARHKAIGHCRAPWYLRGKRGVVVAVHGTFRDPERLAYHLPGLPALPLYKVRFRLADIWPDYDGRDGDNLEADVYETWLAPALAKPRGKR